MSLRRSVGLILFLVIAILAVPKLVSLGSGTAPPPLPLQPPEKLPVKSFKLVPEPLEERLATTGTIRADEHVELVSEVAGKVSAIHFQEGSRVVQGQLLLAIDDTEIRAQQARVVHQLELAEQREKRQRELLEQGVISQQDYDSVYSELQVLQAEQQLWEARQVKTQIRAPFAGVIGLRYVSAGSYLTPQTLIATLQALDMVKIDFSVPEKYTSAVVPGREIAFRVKSKDQPFRGVITAIEPNVDSGTRSLTLRARCANPDHLLWPGAFADVELVVRRIEGALSVPSIAVIPELGGKKVFVVQNGVARERQVETGIRTADRVQILRGLAAGDEVIISGLQRLRSETAVAAELVDPKRALAESNPEL